MSGPKKSKRRVSAIILGIFVLLLLSTLILLQTSNLWKDLTVETASDTLLLYALSSLNFIAFVIFGFIFLRSIVKLVRERRKLQLGSKLKTKLLIYFAAVSVLPIIAMATFSYLYMNRAIERWFTQIPENVVRKSRDLQEQAINERNRQLDETALMLASFLQRQHIDSTQLSEMATAGGLTRIILQNADGSTAVDGGKQLNDVEQAQLASTLEIYRSRGARAPELRDGVAFDVSTAPLPGGRNLLVITDAGFDRSVSKVIDDSLREFDLLKEQQISVRQIALLTLGVLSFLLIFASSWIAFYIARGLTTPIRALAEGAREIAGGNLGHQVDVAAEDELALLVVTFNEMSSRLEENSVVLRERQRYIETVLSALPTGVVSLTNDVEIETVNAAAAKMLGADAAALAGQRFHSVVDTASAKVFDRVVGRALRTGRASEQFELFSQSPDGQAVPVALTAAALPGERGVVLVMEDLSELIAAQRASAWREVARRMAHEIKNPLTPIQLSAERIAKKFRARRSAAEPAAAGFAAPIIKADDTESVVAEGTSTILREVDSLKAMVDEFSQFARLPDVKLEESDLNEIVKQAAALYKDRLADIELSLRLEDDLPILLLDAEQSKRVFVNLVDNAVEAFDDVPSEKVITIATRYDRAREIVVAEVTDNGRGFPPSAIQKLFQPYFSTKGRGTGLGLAIVHRIVTEHNAKIIGTMNQPRGAKFIVEFPLPT